MTYNGSGSPVVSITAGQSTAASAGLGTEGFFLDSGAVLGEYPIRIGASAANDAANGVLLGYVRENGRNVSDPAGPVYATSSTVRDGDPTSVNTRGGTGGLSLAVSRAGAGSATFPEHAPFAANLAAAYFPYSQGWLGGTVSSSTLGGALNQFSGSPGLALGSNFVVDGVSANKHRLVLPGVTDSRRQGLLFVNQAQNKGSYALSEPDDNGNGFVVVTHDNATDGSAVTADPLSFLFIPLNTPNVTMGRIHPSSGQDLQPTAMLKSGSSFTIVREGDVVNPAFDSGVGGKYRLSIPGQSPSSGTLLVSPSTVGRNANGGNTDNVVTYQADGNDWIILAQDLPNLAGEGVFSRERHSYFNFAFVPFNAPPTAPAAIAPPTWNRSRIVGWNANLVREADGQETGGTYASIAQSTSGITVQGLSENYGDYAFAIDGDFMTLQDGVMFTSVREGLRDNTLGGTVPGGWYEYGISSVGLFAPEWAVFVDSASPNQGEHEVNVAGTFFGINSGFTLGSQIDPDNGRLTVSLPGVNTRQDGVLIVQEGSNGDNYALVTPNADGSAWDIEVRDDGTTLSNLAGDRVNYVYLPYESQNLVAGWVNEDGSLLSSTDQSGFTLTKDSSNPGTYLLSIPGKSPETGSLLLSGTGENGSVDNVLVYEAAGNDFRILGLDMTTVAEANGGELIDLEDTEFSFAYIDFNAPPIAPDAGLAGDADGDGDVDGRDLLVIQRGFGSLYDAGDIADWQQNYGMGGSLSAAVAVPEPTSAAILLSAVAALAAARRSASR